VLLFTEVWTFNETVEYPSYNVGLDIFLVLSGEWADIIWST